MKSGIGIFALRQRWRWSLLCLAGAGLAACGASGDDAARTSAVAAPTRLAGGATMVAAAGGDTKGIASAQLTYSITNLDPGNASGVPVINGSNQVAFTAYRDGALHSMFFSGETARDLGNFGGVASYLTALNDAGQVAGVVINADQARQGFRWSEAGGMVPLGTLCDVGLLPNAINRLGQITGSTDDRDRSQLSRAFFWSDTDGARDLGGLGNGASFGEAINDAGIVAGSSRSARGALHAFGWTAASGMFDLGTPQNMASTARLINSAGQVAGSLRGQGASASRYRGFVWDKDNGMVDIGTLGGNNTFVNGQEDYGMVVGASEPDPACASCQYAVFWTRREGLSGIGRIVDGGRTEALAVNIKQEVVGWAEVLGRSPSMHGWVGNRAYHMNDLNERTWNRPPGMTLTVALANSATGAIIADSNAGLVLLTPGMSATDTPVVGPITPDGPVQAGTPTEFSASFIDPTYYDTHSAIWSWNDGCGGDTAGNVTPGGTVSASHTFCRAGYFWVTVKVTDSSGRNSTVGRHLAVYGGGQVRPTVAGSGWFMSPRGAFKKDALQSGPAHFGFVATAINPQAARERKMTLRFRVANLVFESAAYEALSVGAGRAQYRGRGTVNGGGNYHFTLTATAGGADTGARVRMKIWHADALARGDVVDYDNEGGPALGGEGSAIADGHVVIRQ